ARAGQVGLVGGVTATWWEALHPLHHPADRRAVGSSPTQGVEKKPRRCEAFLLLHRRLPGNLRLDLPPSAGCSGTFVERPGSLRGSGEDPAFQRRDSVTWD